MLEEIRYYFEDFDVRRDLPKLIAVVAIVAVAIFLGFKFFVGDTSSDGSEQQVEQTVPFDAAADGNSLRDSATSFIGAVGNFGYNFMDAKNANALELVEKEAQQSPNSKDNAFYVSRSTAYLNARDNLIAKGSPLYYESSIPAGWSQQIETGTGGTDRLFRVQNVSFDSLPDKVTMVDYNGTQSPIAELKGKLTSKVSYALKTGHDSTWDGRYNIMEKTVDDVDFTLRMIKVQGEWRPYELRNVEKDYLLATWKTPEFSFYAEELMRGFEQTGYYRIDVNQPGRVIIDDGTGGGATPEDNPTPAAENSVPAPAPAPAE